VRVNIEAERVRGCMTKEALSARLGISPRTYSNYIKGNTPIPSDVLLNMSQIFKCTTDYLLGLETRDSA